MKDFKKRSLVLMLASVITVTGSFAADNYKNCLMDMTFKATGANEISMVLSTKRLYEGAINPIKRDANTYIITLPEVDSSAPTPDLSEANGNIESVSVKRMPYANGSKGYTRITIKTADSVNLSATSTIYLPDKDKEEARQNENNSEDEESARREAEERALNLQPTQQKTNVTYQQRNKYKTEARPKERSSYRDEKVIDTNQRPTSETAQQNNTDTITQPIQDVQTQIGEEDNNGQKYMLGLWVVLIIMTSIYFYIKAQDKLRNVLGEKLEIDVKEEKKKKLKNKKDNKNVAGTINKIDAAYSKTAFIPPKPVSAPVQEEEPQEELNIVDLDALFKEQTKTQEPDSEEEESDALDDFLSGFSFDDEFPAENEEATEEKELFTFDENVYEQVLNDKELKFTEEDMICFNELLQSEISGEVMNNLSQYAVSNPIAPKKPAKESVLANFVTDFAINQNISFSAEDINALKKLMSVEIDSDFVTNLKTNPERTQAMEQEILNSKPKKVKPTELMTLNVKDMLPNLADELKQHGNRPIESNAKPETVYFSEGYEVSTLKLDFDMPDLAKEVNNVSAYKAKPSEKVQVVDNSYSDSVEKLTISGLPDLKDVMKNPDKYKEPEPEIFVADENSLLSSIANVQFKPFDDGTRNFEIINKDEDILPANDNDYDDFEALYNQEFYDLDSIARQEQEEKEKEKEKINNKKTVENTKQKPQIIKPEEIHTKPLVRAKQPVKKRETKQTPQIEQLLNNAMQATNEHPQSPAKKQQEQKAKKSVINNIAFNIINSVEIDNNSGCYLAKSENGYAVLFYKGQDTEVLKEYDSVKSEKIQLRIHETLSDGTPRYLIKVGINKFVADYKGGKLSYVMDLC